MSTITEKRSFRLRQRARLNLAEARAYRKKANELRGPKIIAGLLRMAEHDVNEAKRLLELARIARAQGE